MTNRGLVPYGRQDRETMLPKLADFGLARGEPKGSPELPHWFPSQKNQPKIPQNQTNHGDFSVISMDFPHHHSCQPRASTGQHGQHEAKTWNPGTVALSAVRTDAQNRPVMELPRNRRTPGFASESPSGGWFLMWHLGWFSPIITNH